MVVVLTNTAMVINLLENLQGHHLHVHRRSSETEGTVCSRGKFSFARTSSAPLVSRKVLMAYRNTRVEMLARGQ